MFLSIPTGVVDAYLRGVLEAGSIGQVLRILGVGLFRVAGRDLGARGIPGRCARPRLYYQRGCQLGFRARTTGRGARLIRAIGGMS